MTLFKTKTRDQWCELLDGTDVCFSPVLDLEEAPNHPHNQDRDTFVNFEGVTQPAPAPRFSRTQGKIQSSASLIGENSEEILEKWGFTNAQINSMRDNNIIL